MRHILTILLLFLCTFVQGRKIEYQESLTSSITLTDSIDLHLTNAEMPIPDGMTIDLCSTASWLFLDYVKPNDVVRNYAQHILIGGEPLSVDDNARVVVFRQGSVIMPHGSDYEALSLFSEDSYRGEEERMKAISYYSNCPPDSAPESLRQPLLLDNRIHSLILRRGYMATLACEPDGMGYSCVFIADEEDLRLTQLPVELDGKVSFVRVLRWQYPSKKGWAGSTWSSMPEGLKYAPQQADLTNSTWYYNWGTRPSGDTDEVRKSRNQEYVPEKWGAGGSWTNIYSLDYASHLMGYNEPDHTEQSNVSVERAIEEWPHMMRTGMRLGSPATTNFSWLYGFMDKVRELNYRVDYVVIHAYWGGMSGAEWYEKLKEVHERTGRPLWIKEWNNGANWTKESWPSGTEAQQARQLRDLTEILTMLDTCSFVERYSIYNWVEEKRMVISSSAQLTPAGKYYADLQPPYFFRHDKEVVPRWRIFSSPVLRYEGVVDEGVLRFYWTDANGEQIERFTMEESTDEGSSFSPIAQMAYPTCSTEMDISRLTTDALLRVTSYATNGTQKPSNTIAIRQATRTEGEPLLYEALVRETWQPIRMQPAFPAPPALLLGVPSYRNKMPLTASARNVTASSFDLQLGSWQYQQEPTFLNPDTMACLALPTGTYQWGEINAQVGVVGDVGVTWQTVVFPHPMDATPVVIASLQAICPNLPVAVAVRNVSREGFEVRLRTEEANAGQQVKACIAYIAATPGEGQIGGKTLLAALTPAEAVGDIYTGGYTLELSSRFGANPHVFAQMQSENDSLTATLRIYQRTPDAVALIKEREKSLSFVRTEPEQVGYLLIGHDQTDDIATPKQSMVNGRCSTEIFTLSGLFIGSSISNVPRTELYLIRDSQGSIRKHRIR